jgi:hypothetical protein
VDPLSHRLDVVKESASFVAPSSILLKRGQLLHIDKRIWEIYPFSSKMTATNSGNLSPEQQTAISAIERAGSVLSILGCIIIIVTFSISKAFHKPINRLVFYASFGNMMTNVATLIARDLVAFPDSVGCQFQGFLVQM